jgi:hypothetical protein
LFVDFSPGPKDHFRICLFGSILGVIEGVSRMAGSLEAAVERFPFLASYNNELAERLSGLSLAEAAHKWCTDLDTWEAGIATHLPLRALRLRAGLSQPELLWLLTLAVIEEDGRFGFLFETLQGTPDQHRPSLGFMLQCLTSPSAQEQPAELLQRLLHLGALQVSNPESPRPEWIFRFPNLVLDLLRSGECHLDPQRFEFRAAQDALPLSELILPPDIQAQIIALATSLAKSSSHTIVVRGSRHNGRRTLLGALARAQGRGVLEILPGDGSQKIPATEVGLLAVLLDALPILEITNAPGETTPIPDIPPDSLGVGVATAPGASLAGPRSRDAVMIVLPLPTPLDRERLWRRAGLAPDSPHVSTIAKSFRLPSGNIQRAAQLGLAQAQLASRSHLEPADVLLATRALDRERINLLAQRLPGTGDLNALCASNRTLEELEHLIRRCRHRESLPASLAGSPAGPPTAGVRALLTGPTGTGKTLAARLLAGSLQKDLYRLDLSSVVNKYIGETEKNLHRLFESAEELDVILLLDEGDALLTRRTDVHTANDRYANLETNFLLQRMETFQGILLITTNARDRIDTAFERRMDVVVEFSPPTPEERWELWRRHLPATAAVDHPRLAEIAAECELTGGQIHNAVMYATLLALDNGGTVTADYIDAAVRREYRKRGGVCPLRR